MFEAWSGGLVTEQPASSERHRGGAQNYSLMRFLMRFLSKQDEVMPGSTNKLKGIRQRNVNGLLHVFRNRWCSLMPTIKWPALVCFKLI
jgi:hypothetical protein